MKRFFRSLLVLLVAACLLTALPAATVSADSAGDSQRWNIMVVMDASGSMDSRHGTNIPTDPDGLRFEAVHSFLAVLHDDGHNVGALSFHASSNPNNPTYGAILAETELMSLDHPDPSWPTGYNAKDKIMDTLQSKKSNKSGNATDIGSALLRAVEILEEADNDLPSAILVFTDGKFNSDFPAVSNSNCEAALDKIRNWNGTIELCGVYLNVRQGESGAGIQDILKDVYGEALGNHYVEITDPAECVASTDKFMRLLGFVEDPDDIVFSDKLEDSFLIPGVGVEAFSIRLNAKDSNYLPDMDVQIFPPNSSTPLSTSPNSDLHLYAGDTFQVWKVKNPQAGKWTIKINVRERRGINISYKPIYSVNIGSGLLAAPTTGNMHLKQDITVKGWLAQNGAEITDPAKYAEYSCYLTLTDVQSGNVVREQELVMNNGSYENTIYFDQTFVPYGEYFAQVRYQCGNIVVASDVQQWNLRNNVPECLTPDHFHPTIEYGFLKPSTETIDVSGYFTDAEDGDNIELFIDRNRTDCDMDGLELEDGVLTITPGKAGDGTIALYAVDQDGASTQNSALSNIKIHVEDMTIRIIIILVVTILILLIITIITIVLVSRYLNSKKPDGECRLTVEIDNKPLTIDMTPPGVEGKRSTNLYAMLRRALQKGADSEYTVLSQECRKAGISIADLEEALAEDAGQLKKVSVSVDLGKVKGKKGKTPRIEVAYQKSKATLYGRSMSLTINGKPYDFGYFPPQKDEIDIFNDYGDMGMNKTSKADDDFMNNIFDDTDYSGYAPSEPAMPKAKAPKPAKKQPKKAKSQPADLFEDFNDF